jgi:hypothetical protein
MGRANVRGRKPRARHDDLRYKQKSVRAMRRRHARVARKWQDRGWELVSQEDGRFRPRLTFRKPLPSRRLSRVILTTGLALCLVAAVVAASIRWWPSSSDLEADTRRDAAAAVQALRDGDLETVGSYLAAYRSDRDFAYYFASKTEPRTLGDALGTVATQFDGTEFDADFDRESYEFLIPDLAGVLALAVSTTGEQTLSAAWTDEFVTATTQPDDIASDDEAGGAGLREAQDEANKQNLLLLLANGRWPTAFLKAVANAYVEFDEVEGEDAWPGPKDDGGLYAPAPSGVYLTDGIVALTAALTANPEASAWAFVDFKPGSKEIEGSDYEIGNFTHFLLFEHTYPTGADGTDLGVTVAMTALASAAGSTVASGSTADEPGPLHDAEALTAFANDIKEAKAGSCSWRVYDCVVTAAKAVAHLAKWVWDHVAQWGHLALDAVATVAFVAGGIATATGVGASIGVPLMFIGVAAETANAGWYAVEGDYLMAGVSLAAVVPGMWFTKLAATAKGTAAGAKVVGAVVAAKGATVGRVLETAAPSAERVARVVKVWWKGSKATSTEIAEAGAKKVGTATKATYVRESEFQAELASRIPGASKKQLTTGCESTCRPKRNVDIYDPATGACIEVKVGKGLTNKKHDFKEMTADLALLKNKGCKSVKWVFGPNKNGVVGPHDDYRRELQKRKIPYEIMRAAA